MDEQQYIYETSVNEACSNDTIKAIKDALGAYNSDFLGVPGHYFMITIKQQDKLIAGAFVWTQGDRLYLDALFVDEEHRKSGLGTELQRRIEIKGQELGCKICITDTFGFQAQGFYEKQGYTVFATVPDYIQGYARIYLKKTIETP